MSEGDVDGVAEQLLAACQKGDAHTLQAMMSSVAGLDLSMTTEDGVTLVMHTIIGAGSGVNPDGLYQETIQLLLQSASLSLDTVDTQYGRTAAHWAVFYRRHDLLYQLIMAGADMTTPDVNGTSPFHLSISERASQCLELAIQNLPREILEYPDTNGRSPLEHAIQMGNIEACQMLVGAGASVNAIDQVTGQSPLHTAAMNTSVAIVEFLLLSDAIIDLSDGNGMTPIHLASIAGSRECLAVMVKLAGDAVLSLPNASTGMTPLMYACGYGNDILTKYLLKKKVNGTVRDTQDKTALHWAAEFPLGTGSTCVQMLLKKHRELLEAKDMYGLTPLLCSAMVGQTDSINTLLAAGANINAVDNDGHSAGHWATVSSQPQALLAVLAAGGSIATADSQGAYPIHYAVEGCREPSDEEYTDEAQLRSESMQECLRLILERGGDVACCDAQGMTPLHWALQFPRNKVACSLLLSSGADPRAKDSHGMTGLHVAANRGITENCQFLLEHTGGSIAKELDNQGQSALFAAVESGELECVEYLLQINLSPTATNREGRTPVHVASTMGFTRCLQLLQAYRADLSTRSIHGATSMHEAAANGHTESLEFLLSYGCLPDDPAGTTGATALHYAVTGAHGGCVQSLLHHGASINAIATSENEKLTPLDYCTDYPEMVEYMRSQGAMLGSEIFPPEEGEGDAKKVVETEAEGQSSDIVGPVAESGDVTTDQSEAVEAGTADKPTTQQGGDGDSGEGERRERGEGVRTSRPTTADRRTLSWEEAGGGRGREGEEGREEMMSKMRRPSQQSVERGRTAVSMRPHLLQRALSVLRGNRSPPPSSSVLSSAVGFCAAHATILAATVIGTSVGSKVTKVAEKVATDTAEYLKQAASSFEGAIPDLVWLREPDPPPRPPTPVIVVKPPTPSPSPTPSLEITYEPLERRMRKAKAQMDMSRSTGYRAVEELLKAQTTHTTLRKQFEEARVNEMTLAQRETFAAEEVKKKEQSDAVLRRLNGRIKRADTESELVHDALDRQLEAARRENEKIHQLMREMGVNPRPTVAQWLQQKQQQKKKAMQEALITWDRSKPHRETAILVQQMVTAQRAMKHAAWGASKDISAKIRALKREELLGPIKSLPATRKLPLPQTHRERTTVQSTGKLQGSPHKSRSPAIPVRPKKMVSPKSPPTVKSSVRATPHGFLKIREQDVTTTTSSPRQPSASESGVSEEMWNMGHSYAYGTFDPTKPPRTTTARATGPKSVHAPRTLHFLHPARYKAEKQQQRVRRSALMNEYMTGSELGEDGESRGPMKSFLAMQSLQFGGTEGRKREGGRRVSREEAERGRRASFGNCTTQYHSLADSMSGRSQFPRKRASSVEIPVLPMNILKSSAPSSPVKC